MRGEKKEKKDQRKGKGFHERRERERERERINAQSHLWVIAAARQVKLLLFSSLLQNFAYFSISLSFSRKSKNGGRGSDFRIM